MEDIEFETYNNANIVVSATNVKTKVRIPQTPAAILKNLSAKQNVFLDKELQVELIYGSFDHFKSRSFDVHLNKVKKLLKGSKYKIITKHYQLGLFKLDE